MSVQGEMDEEVMSDDFRKPLSSQLYESFKRQPVLPLGAGTLCLAGLALVVGHGLYNLKNRREKISLYLIGYRLYAQGTFLGCVTLGLAYEMYKKHILKER